MVYEICAPERGIPVATGFGSEDAHGLFAKVPAEIRRCAIMSGSRVSEFNLQRELAEYQGEFDRTLAIVSGRERGDDS